MSPAQTSNQARINMVQSQLVPNNIIQVELLTGMRTLAREDFLDPVQRDFAYSDHSVPVGGGSRRCLKPLQIAQLLQALEIIAGDKVLVVGAGTGYEASLAARLGAAVVVALEFDAGLAARGRELTAGSGVMWQVGPLAEGWFPQAPYDAILFCGAVAAVPPPVLGQLARNGRLTAIVGRPGDVLMNAVLQRGPGVGGRPQVLFETNAFPLPGTGGAAPFVL
ncbi:MAG: protein-L-isoaspartate O-methyltransferase [Magnetococcales bacterium]|nr:protein-L-isoaspartate O-methyltransferase [Magnetococcales bacterium]